MTTQTRLYYHENVLDPIEGIWTVSENTDWENMLTGVKGNNEIAGKYEVAIIRDKEEYNRYNSYILHSRQLKNTNTLWYSFIETYRKGIFDIIK